MSSENITPFHIAGATVALALGAYAAYKLKTNIAVDAHRVFSRFSHGREIPTQVSRTAADAVIVRPKKDGEGHEIMLITRLKKTF